MKASVMKRIPVFQQSSKGEALVHHDFAHDKGSKCEPFYIAAIGSDRRSLARAIEFDRRR